MHAFAIPPSCLAFLSLSLSAFGIHWTKIGTENRVGSSKEDDGKAERSGVVRIRLRRVISRRGRSEREPVKRNNASRIILLPVKRGIYLQISGELSRFYKTQNSIPGGNSTRMLHIGYSKGLATPLQPNKDMGHCCSTAHKPGRANHYLLQRALSVTERGNAK